MSCRPSVLVLGASWLALVLVGAPAVRAQYDFPLPGAAAQGSQSGHGSGAFAGLASALGADPASGAAVTSIPIEVPPGRLLMTPRLELVYSSHGGPSPYGFGWDLPIGRISRSLKWGVPRYDNDPHGGDTFILEFAGQAIELEHAGGKLYRARFEGSHFKIGFQDGAENFWKVFDKNGNKYIFGKQSADAGAPRHSRMGPDVSTSTGTYAWLLESAEDIFGNRIDYHYGPTLPAEPGPRGLPEEIRYGGFGPEEHIFRIAFHWSSTGYPSAPALDYSAGFARPEGGLRLDAITTHVAAGVEAAPFDRDENVVREYVFVHDDARDKAGTHTLAGVGLTAYAGPAGGPDVTAPETVFLYSRAIVTGWPLGAPQDRSDAAIRFPSPGPFRHLDSSSWYDVFDINGDGLVDYVGKEFLLPNFPPSVRLGTGSGFGAWQPWPWPGGGGDSKLIRKLDGGGNITVDIVDVTGDGLPDLVDARQDHHCSLTTPSSCVWLVYENTGHGFAQSPLSWAAPHAFLRDTGGSGALRRDTVDMNNDGLPDFVDSRSDLDGHWDVYWNTGAGFVTAPERVEAPAADIAVVDASPVGIGTVRVSGLFDINGDGLPDHVDAFDGASRGALHNSQYAWTVRLNNGSGFESPVPWGVEGWGSEYGLAPLPGFYAHVATNTSIAKAWTELIDMTGDGLPDLLRPIQVDPATQAVGEDESGNGPQLPGAACGDVPQCAIGVAELPGCCRGLLLFVNTGGSFSSPVIWNAWGAEWPGVFSERLRHYSDAVWPVDGREYDLFDFDGDGLVDLVERIGPDDEWHVYRHPAAPVGDGDLYRTKPNLLVGMLNGAGGETLLEYAPVTMLGDSPCSYADDATPVSGDCVPFPYWVVTAEQSSDVFSDQVLGNSEPARTSFAYADGIYDGRHREFRGFGRVWSRDSSGKIFYASFHQDEARFGLLDESWLLGDPGCDWAPLSPSPECDPWKLVLSHEDNVWPDVDELLAPEPPLRLDLLLAEHINTPYKHDASATASPEPVTSLARHTHYRYDEYGNEIENTVVSNAGSYVFSTLTDYEKIDPPPASTGLPLEYRVGRATRVLTLADGSNSPLSEKRFEYRNRSLRSVSTCRRWNSEGSCIDDAWSVRRYWHRAGGLVRKTMSPLRDKARVANRDFDAHGLYALATKIGRLRTRRETTYDYRTGKLLSVTGPDGETYRTSYDGLGRAVEFIGPDFDGQGDVVERRFLYLDPVLDPLQPDASVPGHVIVESANLAPTVTYYDGRGRELYTKTMRRNEQGTLRGVYTGIKRFDAGGRVIAVAVAFDGPHTGDDPEMVESDALGDFDRTLISSVPGWTEYVYDPITGRPLAKVLPDERSTSVLFDFGVPGVRATVDANQSEAGFEGAVTLEYFDGLGRLLSRELCSLLPDLYAGQACPAAALLSKRSFEYDGLDRPIREWLDGVAGPLRVVEYDGMGNETFIDEADSGMWMHGYDAAGNVVTSIDPRGQRILRRYWKSGEPREIRGPTTRVRFRYHRKGLGAGKVQSISVETSRTGASPATIERHYAYNRRGLVAGERLEVSTGLLDVSGFDFAHGYELPDRVNSTRYPGGVDGAYETVTTGYDALSGLPVSLSTSVASTGVAADAGYDVLGNLAWIEYGNGTVDLFSHDDPVDGGRLRCVTTDFIDSAAGACVPSSRALRSLDVSRRDALGRILEISDRLVGTGDTASAHQQVTYDRVGRVASVDYGQGLGADSDTFAYGPTGNLTARNDIVFAYDPSHPHQMSAWWQAGSGPTAVGHDANGNLVTGRFGRSLEYDEHDRLARVSAGSVMVQENFYDHSTTRVARYDEQGAATHYFNGLFEIDFSADEIVRHFYFGSRPVASDRISRFPGPGDQDGAATPSYYHLDHLGSPQVVTDGDGNVVEQIRYRVFGEVRGVWAYGDGQPQEASSVVSEFGFAGQEADEETGYLYFGARFMDPERGSFLTHDPKRQFASPYTYAGFDPVNGVDPDGTLVLGLGTAEFFTGLFAAATFVDVLLDGADLGAALAAAGSAGATSLAFGPIQGGLTAPLAGVALGSLNAAQLADLVLGVSSAAESFRSGAAARGVAGVSATAFGLSKSLSVASSASAIDDDARQGAAPAARLDGDGILRFGVLVAGGNSAIDAQALMAAERKRDSANADHDAAVRQARLEELEAASQVMGIAALTLGGAALLTPPGSLAATGLSAGALFLSAASTSTGLMTDVLQSRFDADTLARVAGGIGTVVPGPMGIAYSSAGSALSLLNQATSPPPGFSMDPRGRLNQVLRSQGRAGRP